MLSTMHFRFFRSFVFAAFTAAAALHAMSPAELATRLSAGDRLLIVDLRPGTIYADGHIPGAINIPVTFLADKQLPSAQPVVIYGDGLGVVDETKALAILQRKPGIQADVLEGGYAAWLAQTRLTTARTGVQPERIPGITYQQLVDSRKADMVLVDLRATVSPPTAGAPAAKTPARAAAAAQPDLVAEFARKLGVPLVASTAGTGPGAAPSAATASSAAGTPPRAAAALPEFDGTKLLVLVADDEATSTRIARELRASGHYRFTVLIGGTDIIRHEGKQGTGRMDGGTSGLQRQP
jgi:rhodanese-related sulfurtransferase